jgi:hypothetical protein
MRVVELKNLQRNNIPIFYLKKFTGRAVLEFRDNTTEKSVEFIVERKPSGAIEVRVTILDELEYPLIPVVRGLKTYITEMESEGRLP